MSDTDTEALVHKAEPAPIPDHLGDVAAWVCRTCGADIKRVPGGQRATWVHTATGAVAGPGGPR